MSDRRALVGCAVLSVCDACVFYPCCKGCFSRVDVEQRDTTRCRCSRCGYSCPREQVDSRYRLSLRVTRDRCIFGVTVFGTCLNPFFGIPASGLRRMVENEDGPVGASTRASLLMKAVEDCFIGRHFIFGIKVTGTESRLWLEGPGLGRDRDRVQFIASQMILPKAAGPGGCTVASYYRTLLQKAAEYELGSSDYCKTSRIPEKALLMIPHHSSASGFNNTTLSASGLLSPSLQRSHHQDSTLTPTPPWQQSLGLVTSSAEQEEGCSTRDNGDENSRQTDNNKTTHRVQRGCLGNHKVAEDRTLSPLSFPELSSYDSASFAQYTYRSSVRAVETPPLMNTLFSPSQPGHNRDSPLSYKTKGPPPLQLNETSLSSSLAWEDLPFSESLTEFVCEEHKDFDIVSETEPRPNVRNQKETVRNDTEIVSQEKSLSIHSTSVCQNNSQISESHSSMVQNITNTLNNRGDQAGKNYAGCVKKIQARSNCFHQCDQEDKEASSLSFDDKEAQREEDAYDCSVDLFSSSIMSDMNIKTFNMHTESDGITTETCPLPSSPGTRPVRSEQADVPYSTPHERKPKRNKCTKRDSFIPPGTQDLDFLPPAQSTPIVKVAVVSGSPPSSLSGEFSSQPDGQDVYPFYSDLPELDSKKSKIAPSHCKLNTVAAKQPPRCGRESTKENLVWSETSIRHDHILTPKRRFWKPNKHKNLPLAPQHLRVRRAVPSPGSPVRTNRNCDSSVCDLTVCECEDSKVVVPPTPVANARLGVKPRRRRPSDGSSSCSLDCTWKAKQGDGVNCKRILLDHRLPTLTSSRSELAPAGNCDSEVLGEGSLDTSDSHRLNDENQACDWSRDLFSDSA
uniref:Replication factor A C-terminal domain-containing protein n=1 Tax=Scophthalmus maximus TaxID=52904 RepID=A0A8D3BRX6_SCOMX